MLIDRVHVMRKMMIRNHGGVYLQREQKDNSGLRRASDSGGRVDGGFRMWRAEVRGGGERGLAAVGHVQR